LTRATPAHPGKTAETHQARRITAKNRATKRDPRRASGSKFRESANV